MSTGPLHPHAVWNPAFRPNTTSSLPPLLSIATTTTPPPPHAPTTHLHNVTPFAAAAASASASKLDAGADLKSVPLGDDARDLEAGGVVMKQRGVRARVEGWWAWFACLLLMGFTTVGLGTCFAFGG
ncbi:hypothetical protein VF21_00563 [Pseudogymnoascus sp. 05NY08]|nr:hypothetical protein VF21_00563 [Pseudogymnoascus sp. 05NY08]